MQYQFLHAYDVFHENQRVPQGFVFLFTFYILPLAENYSETQY